MKKITKVLACLLSPLALISCGKDEEIKIKLKSTGEDFIKVEGIKDGDIFFVDEKGVKHSIITKDSVKGYYKFKYKLCYETGNDKDKKEFCSKEEFTDLVKVAEFASNNKTSLFTGSFEEVKK